MFCPSCKHENRAGRRFCVHCGAGLDLSCPSCGASAEPGERFCGECGKNLAGVPQTSATRDPRSYTPKHLADKILTSRAVHRQTRIDECVASLALARVLVQAEGTRARAEIEAAVVRGLALVEETGAALYKPRFHVERAELARLLGDEPMYRRELREAHRLFTEMGATMRAEEVARDFARDLG
jgi:hypothetical protein